MAYKFVNHERSRVEIYFDEKPSVEVREYLKDNHFRWYPQEECWYCYKTSQTIAVADKALEMVSPKPTKTISSYNKEINANYNNFYVETKQEISSTKTSVIKLYLYGEDDYIVQSSFRKIRCPFCNHVFSVYAFSCDGCGHTMHEICQDLYSKWNISGHRFYITWQAIDKYPPEIRQRTLYNAIRDFVKESIPFSVRNHFNDVINEVHLNTLVTIYQKSLGFDKVEEEILEEVTRGEKILFKRAVKDDLNNNSEAIALVWKYFQKYLSYKERFPKLKPSDFFYHNKAF